MKISSSKAMNRFTRASISATALLLLLIQICDLSDGQLLNSNLGGLYGGLPSASSFGSTAAFNPLTTTTGAASFPFAFPSASASSGISTLPYTFPSTSGYPSVSMIQPSTSISTTTCHTYKAFIQSTSATSVNTPTFNSLYAFGAKGAEKRRLQQAGVDGMTHGTSGFYSPINSNSLVNSGYDVIMMEAIPLSDTHYRCTLYSESTSISKYSFRLQLSPVYNTGSSLLYSPVFTDLTSIGIGGMELTGEQAVLASTDYIAVHLRSLVRANHVMFAPEGHIVFYVQQTTLVFVKSCSTTSSSITPYASPTVNANSGFFPTTASSYPFTTNAASPFTTTTGGFPYGFLGLEQHAQQQRRRLQEESRNRNIASIVYGVDQKSYKVNGTEAYLTNTNGTWYDGDLDMECRLPEGNKVSCSFKVANVMRFTLTVVNNNGTVTPGPIMSTMMMPLGDAAAVESNINRFFTNVNHMDVLQNGNLIFKTADGAQLTFVPKRLVGGKAPDSEVAAKVAAEAVAVAARRLGDSSDDWDTFEATLDSYSENGISGQSLFVGDSALLGSLSSFPFRCSTKRLSETTYTVILKIVNEYQMQIVRNPTNNRWACSTPVPMTQFVGPAPSMLMETRMLNAFTSLNSFNIRDDRLMIGGMEASITFKEVDDEDVEIDNTMTLDVGASHIDGESADELEGASAYGKINVRVTQANRDTYKCLVKGANTYTFDIQMVQNRPICSPIVTCQVVQPQMQAVERRVLNIFQTATTFIPRRSGCEVVSPRGSLRFI